MSLEGTYGLGISTTTVIPVNCPDCGMRLTAIAVNDKCIINFKIECVKCHGIAVADNLWAEMSDKEPPQND